MLLPTTGKYFGVTWIYSFIVSTARDTTRRELTISASSAAADFTSNIDETLARRLFGEFGLSST
jgi:hypothetical protein